MWRAVVHQHPHSLSALVAQVRLLQAIAHTHSGKQCRIGEGGGNQKSINVTRVIRVIRVNCIVLYCIVLYCIVLYCIVLHCSVLYCTVLYGITLLPDFAVDVSFYPAQHRSLSCSSSLCSSPCHLECLSLTLDPRLGVSSLGSSQSIVEVCEHLCIIRSNMC